MSSGVGYCFRCWEIEVRKIGMVSYLLGKGEILIRKESFVGGCRRLRGLGGRELGYGI